MFGHHRYDTAGRILATLLAMVVLAGPAAARSGTPDKTDKSTRDDSRIVVIDDDGEQTTLTLENGELTVVTTDGDETETRIINLEAMGLLAGDIMDEAQVDLAGLLKEIESMQFQCRLGQDNRLNLSFDDSEFELDLDQVMAQVASAVQLGLSEIRTSEWTSRSNRWDEVSDDELRDELENLKVEMQELRKELQNLQKEKTDR